ncbi:MAG: 16S rRNA (guanine(527)-N(7))-methyltransferase RsmG [Dysgonamonadaceae bacterium]|nr:16S rRNA (guanine(527)-N(7))-methyltransferase RsmG [Dysgonamonadaceae bacterium]
MKIILEYFPNLTNEQCEQLEKLGQLYLEWNRKVNLISRQDTDNLYERHILHSLSIAKILRFKDNTSVIDIGTGGGFPGIPLAVMFPQVRFLLVDSIGKKINVVKDIARQANIDNVECEQIRIENEYRKFDFAVTRAAMSLENLVRIAKKNIASDSHNAMPNGFICLKGGNITQETKPFANRIICYKLSDYLKEKFFETKKVIYLQA